MAQEPTRVSGGWFSLQHQEPIQFRFLGATFFLCPVVLKAHDSSVITRMIYAVSSEHFAQFLSFSSQRAWYRTHDPADTYELTTGAD